MRRGMMSFLVWGVVAYVIFGGILFGCQRSLLYHPNQELPKPAEYGLKAVKAIWIETNSGRKLLAWWHKPQMPNLPTIVYFHGNAGHLGHRAEKIRPYVDAGLGMLLVSYSYNAGAGGTPSEKSLHDDGRSAIRFIQKSKIPSESIVLYGESLGTGVAVTMAVENKIGGVVLEAPYTSIADVAQSHYWYLPARFLVLDKFEIADKVAHINAPLLVVHGERDTVIPAKFGRALFEKAKEPKVGKFIKNAGHNDLYDHGMPKIVLKFLKSYFGPFTR